MAGLRYPIRDPIERIYERATQHAQNKILGVSSGSGAVARGGFPLASPATEEGEDDDDVIYTIHEFLTELDSTEDPTTQLS